MRERTSRSARFAGLALEALGELGAAAHRLAEQDPGHRQRLLHERGDVGHRALLDGGDLAPLRRRRGGSAARRTAAARARTARAASRAGTSRRRVAITVVTLETIDVAVEVTTFCTPPMSLAIRDWISPVRVRGEEREREPLQVAVDLRAQVVHDALADEVGEPGLADAEHAGGDRDADHPGDEHDQQPVVVLRDRDVEHVAQQERRDHRQHRRDAIRTRTARAGRGTGGRAARCGGSARASGLARGGGWRRRPPRSPPPLHSAGRLPSHSHRIRRRLERERRAPRRCVITGWNVICSRTSSGTSSRSPRLRSGRITSVRPGRVRGEHLLLEPADRQHAALQRDLAGHADGVLAPGAR